MALSMLNNRKRASLVLADGSVFPGYSIGVQGMAVGEVVFNTSMTGYQEILTDPSYCEQIVTLTYPHIGNTGVNGEDMESEQVWAKGLIIREDSPVVSSWRAEGGLEAFLSDRGVVAIAGVDTRALTRHLREHGAQNGCIVVGDEVDEALQQAKAFDGLNGKNLAKVVSSDVQRPTQSGAVVLVDFGYKQNIYNLLERSDVIIVPHNITAEELLALKPQGILLSNGPGDPAACDYAIKMVQELLQHEIPIFGICLGCQILALAMGAKTRKMKFGHHGANHPVQNLQTKSVAITSQNHGFCIDEAALPGECQVTHRSLFDNSIQGIKHKTKPFFAFQGHPEASPGPHDIEAEMFEYFRKLIAEFANGNN